MGKFDQYNIQLKTMEIGKSQVEYHLDNAFFALLEDVDIQKGDVDVTIRIDKRPNQSELNFELVGKVVVPCDRCLEDMDQPIKTTGHLIVKFGKEFKDDGDDIVIVPEEQGLINVSWFLYEFIELAIPIKHVHPFGLCNKGMSKKLGEHLSVDAEGLEFSDSDLEAEDDASAADTDEPAGSPWEALKALKTDDGE